MSDLRNNRQRQEDEEDVIDLLPLLKALWRSAWIIVTIAILAGSATYLGTKLLVTPTYRASFTAYVNNRNKTGEDTTTVTSSDLTASKSLVYTYSEIMTSRSMLLAAAEQAGIAEDYETIAETVSTNIVSETEIVSVYVTMEDPAQATAMAGAIADLAPGYISQIVEGTSMQIIDQPVMPTDIYSPSYLKNTLIGLVLGGVICCAVIVLKELIDDRIKGEEELENRFGLAIVGTIPNLVTAGKIDDSYGYGYGSASKKKGGSEQR